jgi:hypothetical protein
MKRYAVSVMVNRPGENRHTAFVVDAASDTEAEGLAYRIARKLYPGWWSYHVVVHDVATPSATVENASLTGEC